MCSRLFGLYHKDLLIINTTILLKWQASEQTHGYIQAYIQTRTRTDTSLLAYTYVKLYKAFID